jgi:SAM-dependent methyltransferase
MAANSRDEGRRSLGDRQAARSLKILDLGCGKHKTPGAIGIDINPKTDADVIHDLNQFPYPFPDNEFDLIIGNQVIEHLADIPAVMAELYRIAKPGARIILETPHYTDVASFCDPTHRHHLTSESFSYFSEKKKPEFAFYSDITLRTRVIRITLLRFWRLLGFELLVNSPNRFPSLRFIRRFWEAYLSFIIRGKTLHFEFEVIKDQRQKSPAHDESAP